MKTKEERKVVFEQQLKKTRRLTVWISLLVVLGVMVYIIFDPPNYFIGLGIGILFFFPSSVVGSWRSFNTVRSCSVLRRKLKEEEEYMQGIRKDYTDIISCKFHEIPARLRATAIYLLSNPDKGPEEIMKTREANLENIKIKIQIFLDSPEKNFWQYFASWKWLTGR